MCTRHHSRKLGLAIALMLAPYSVAQGVASRVVHAETVAGGASADWTRSGVFGNFTLGASQGPIHVSADQLEFDYKNRVLTYRGGVEVTQGDVSLHSNMLTVHFDEHAQDRDRLEQIVAEGEVRIGKGERFATGGRAVFDQATKTVVLSQDAVLHDGPNRVAGERVVVYLDEGRSVVEGGEQRVHAVLTQPEQATNPNASTGEGDGRER